MPTTQNIVRYVVGLLIVVALLYSAGAVHQAVSPKISQLPSMDQVKTYVALAFSAVVALAFLFCLFAMFYLRLKNAQADISVWLNIDLTCLGYIVGILAGLFGIAPPK